MGAAVDRLKTQSPFALESNFDAYVFRIDINSNVNMFDLSLEKQSELKKCFGWFSDTTLTVGKQRIPIGPPEV